MRMRLCFRNLPEPAKGGSIMYIDMDHYETRGDFLECEDEGEKVAIVPKVNVAAIFYLKEEQG